MFSTYKKKNNYNFEIVFLLRIYFYKKVLIPSVGTCIFKIKGSIV